MAVAQTAMPASAEPDRSHIVENLGLCPSTHVVCPFLDTTAPTKEGLLQNARIVSNLHRQVSLSALGIGIGRHYGAPHSNGAAACRLG
jgi:hypothetical protein